MDYPRGEAGLPVGFLRRQWAANRVPPLLSQKPKGPAARTEASVGASYREAQHEHAA